MIQNTDIAGRLRLFRYGLIVLVVITFMVSLFAPYSYISAYLRPTAASLSITAFLGQALLYTVIVGILSVAAYFGYRYWLTRSPMAHA